MHELDTIQFISLGGNQLEGEWRGEVCQQRADNSRQQAEAGFAVPSPGSN
jgi:hypothetical protein